MHFLIVWLKKRDGYHQIISATGLRLDGLLALELWDLIVSVLGNASRVSDRSGQPGSDVHKHHKSHNKIDEVKDIDSVPSHGPLCTCTHCRRPVARGCSSRV